MIRTVTYRFDLAGVDPEAAARRVQALALARAKRNRSLYEVRTEVTGAGTEATALLVHITVDGHGYWLANSTAAGEAMAIARTLRVTATLVASETEPTMRNLTVEQGRADIYEERSRTTRQNRAERLERFRERLANHSD